MSNTTPTTTTTTAAQTPHYPPPKPLARDLRSPTNPVVFFDMLLGGEPLGRIKMELFRDMTPITAENFRRLCTGEQRSKNRPVGYKGSRIHRVVPGFVIQGGDFTAGDGTGGECVYDGIGGTAGGGWSGARTFRDENFDVMHSGAGLLSMANSGRDTNGSQFFVTLGPAPHLDGKHVCFGRVLAEDGGGGGGGGGGMEVLRKIEKVRTRERDRPAIDVTIGECGEM